jgi:hypothetical protein
MEAYVLITPSELSEQKLSKTGNWIIYEGKEEIITLIITELSQAVIGINFGIFKEGTTNKINLYKNGLLTDTYDANINKNEILYWSLSNI